MRNFPVKNRRKGLGGHSPPRPRNRNAWTSARAAARRFGSLKSIASSPAIHSSKACTTGTMRVRRQREPQAEAGRGRDTLRPSHAPVPEPPGGVGGVLNLGGRSAADFGSRSATATPSSPLRSTPSTCTTTTAIGHTVRSAQAAPYDHSPSERQARRTPSDGATGSVDSSTSISRSHDVCGVSDTHTLAAPPRPRCPTTNSSVSGARSRGSRPAFPPARVPETARTAPDLPTWPNCHDVAVSVSLLRSHAAVMASVVGRANSGPS